MGLSLALAVASTGIGILGSMSAAAAAKREAALQRRQLQAQIEGAQLAALQDHNARMKNLSTFLGTNEAITGIMGRDTDKSLKALQKRAKTEMATETDRANLQFLQEKAKLSAAQSMATERGRNLSRAYKFQAFSTLFSGATQSYKLYGSKGINPYYHGGT
tara:strand:+ start:1220 stop:1702 length:483 start_codon:yes stop_codon:yes gene_type:complete